MVSSIDDQARRRKAVAIAPRTRPPRSGSWSFGSRSPRLPREQRRRTPGRRTATRLKGHTSRQGGEAGGLHRLLDRSARCAPAPRRARVRPGTSPRRVRSRARVGSVAACARTAPGLRLDDEHRPQDEHHRAAAEDQAGQELLAVHSSSSGRAVGPGGVHQVFTRRRCGNHPTVSSRMVVSRGMRWSLGVHHGTTRLRPPWAAQPSAEGR